MPLFELHLQVKNELTISFIKYKQRTRLTQQAGCDRSLKFQTTNIKRRTYTPKQQRQDRVGDFPRHVLKPDETVTKPSHS
jgi:hypothetical protein